METPHAAALPSTHRTRALMAAAFLALASYACSDQATPVATAPEHPNLVVVDGTDYDLNEGTTAQVNGATWNFAVPFGVGTGQLNPFLSVQAAPTEEGFNTDASPFPLNETRSNFTNPLPLNHVPTIKVGNGFFREFILDANEANSLPDAQFSIRTFDMWVCNDPGAPVYDALSDFENNALCKKVYDLAGRVGRATDAATKGSGNFLDYQILIPEANFQNAISQLFPVNPPPNCTYQGVESAACGLYIVLHVKLGDTSGDWVVGSTFEEVSTLQRPYATVTKTATPAFKRTYKWEIEKSVDKSTITMFPGQSTDANYDVVVTQTGFDDSEWAVSGQVTIQNPSDVAVTVNSVTDLIQPGNIAVTVDCGTLPAVIAAGGNKVCTYTKTFATSPGAGPFTNTVQIELAGLSVVSGVSAPFSFTTPTSEVNKTVDVTDTNLPDPLANDISTGSTYKYKLPFTCNEDEGKHDNIAKVIGDGGAVLDQDDASVTVSCEAITVTKNASPTFDRKWTWRIDKTIDATAFLPGTYDANTNTATVNQNEALDVKYKLTLNASSADQGFKVTGTITIGNPSASQIALTSVRDSITGNILATVTCPSLNVPAEGTLQCSYSANLPNKDSRVNTAKVVLFGEEYTGTAQITFGSTPANEIDECVNVQDVLSQAGNPIGDPVNVGNWCASQGLPKTFEVTKTFGGSLIPISCGTNTFNNEGEFTTNDTETTGSDDVDIVINVNCVQGCTLTQGYWKTHNASFKALRNGKGPAADPTWNLLPGGQAENTIFFLSGQTWFEVFNTVPGGNAYYTLAHQYMAAVLNGLAGADQSAVTTALGEAKTLFETYTPAQVAALKGNNATKAQFISLAGTLGSYNEGLIGPGHCTENVSQ